MSNNLFQSQITTRDIIPTLQFASKNQKSVMIFGAPGCVDRDTEFLTPFGWKPIGSYVEGDQVAQYNNDGSLSFVDPEKYIVLPCSKMYRYSNAKVTMRVCGEHRFVYWKSPSYQGVPAVAPFESVRDAHNKNKSGFGGYVKTTFTYDGEGLDVSEGELRLQVAVMADGHIVKEGKDNYTKMRFKKERKYLRLVEMCKKFGLKYKDNGCSHNTETGSNKEYEVIVWPKWKDKEFTSKYFMCSKQQLQTVTDELCYWDAKIGGKEFFTTKETSRDFVQFAFAATGRRSFFREDIRDKYTNSFYEVYWSENKGVRMLKNYNYTTSLEEFKPKDEKKYCFTVPSGMLILRCEGKIFVTGNCGKSDKVTQFAEEYTGRDDRLIDLRLGNMNPEDVMGITIPTHDETTGEFTTYFSRPSFWPKQGCQEKWVLFLDELTSASPVMQKIAYQILLDRKVGDLKLSDNVVIVGAGNRSGEGLVYELGAAVRNRVIQLEIKPDVDSWVDDYAIPNEIEGSIIAFLKQQTSHFFTDHEQQAFATARSWTVVDSIVKSMVAGELPSSLAWKMIAGSIGEGSAAQFKSYYNVGCNLPSPIDILSGKDPKLDSEMSSAYWTLNYQCFSSWASRFGDKDYSNEEIIVGLDNFMNYMMKWMPKELELQTAFARKIHEYAFKNKDKREGRIHLEMLNSPDHKGLVTILGKQAGLMKACREMS